MEENWIGEFFGFMLFFIPRVVTFYGFICCIGFAQEFLSEFQAGVEQPEAFAKRCKESLEKLTGLKRVLFIVLQNPPGYRTHRFFLGCFLILLSLLFY